MANNVNDLSVLNFFFFTANLKYFVSVPFVITDSHFLGVPG